jgi:hypothetical protein
MGWKGENMIDLKQCVVYDVEVVRGPDEVDGGWENPEGMGFASAVTYSYADERYRFFIHDQGKFNLLDFLAGKNAVSFNGIKFDSRVILSNKRGVTKDGITSYGDTGFGNCDLLLEYIRARFGDPDVGTSEKRLGDKAIHDGSFSLDGLAEGTFGQHKTGHGAKAPILYREGKIAELLEYNLQDVRLTKKLFDFIRQYGFVVDRSGRVVRISL